MYLQMCTCLLYHIMQGFPKLTRSCSHFSRTLLTTAVTESRLYGEYSKRWLLSLGTSSQSEWCSSKWLYSVSAHITCHHQIRLCTSHGLVVNLVLVSKPEFLPGSPSPPPSTELEVYSSVIINEPNCTTNLIKGSTPVGV